MMEAPSGEKMRKIERDGSAPFFSLHFDLHPQANDFCLGADTTEKNLNDVISRIKPDAVTYDCKGHPGYAGYPTNVGTAASGIISDSLALWRKITQKHGVRLGVHYSSVVDHLAVRIHPEWAAVLPDGKRSEANTSTFSPYADQLMIPQLKEIIDAYDIDYVWIDGDCWAAQMDWGPGAIAAWRREHKAKDVPLSASDPNWQEWKQFHREQFNLYLKNWTRTLHAYKAELQLASNCAYSTMMPVPPEAEVDFLSWDFDPHLSVDRARTEARYLSNTGKPWNLLSWGFIPLPDQDESLKSPVQLKQEASVVLMQGGGYGIYYLPTRGGHIKNRIVKTAEQVSVFCRARQSICHGSSSIPQVALLHSSKTQFCRSERVYAWWDTPLNEIDGALHVLLELHYSVDILSEWQLIKRMAEFPVVIIPDSDRLDKNFCDHTLAYVENGGNLVLLGEKCSKHFHRYIGVHPKGKPHEVNAQLETSLGSISVRSHWQDIEIADAEPLLYRYNGDGQLDRFSYLDTRTSGVSVIVGNKIHREPAAVVKRHGKGQIASIFGPLPLLYFNNHHPVLRQAFADILKQVCPKPVVATDAPPCVDLSLRRSSSGYLCVHLANLSGSPSSLRRAFSDYTPPLGPICIRIRSKKKPQKVTWEPGGMNVPWTWKKGITEITVPQLEIHGAVAIR